LIHLGADSHRVTRSITRRVWRVDRLAAAEVDIDDTLEAAGDRSCGRRTCVVSSKAGFDLPA